MKAISRKKESNYLLTKLLQNTTAHVQNKMERLQHALVCRCSSARARLRARDPGRHLEALGDAHAKGGPGLGDPGAQRLPRLVALGQPERVRPGAHGPGIAAAQLDLWQPAKALLQRRRRRPQGLARHAVAVSALALLRGPSGRSVPRHLASACSNTTRPPHDILMHVIRRAVYVNFHHGRHDKYEQQTVLHAW